VSGCCGQGPVIVSGSAATPRVDVETLLLCDVLPDGTVAGIALVEPVYDQATGSRLATRTVDPVTGAPYIVQGTLQQCPESSECPDCQTFILCDVTTVTGPEETPERITNGGFDGDASGWTLSGGAAYVPTGGPDGQVGVLDFSQSNQAAGKAEQTTTVTPGLTYNLSAAIGIWSTGGTTPQSVLVEVLDGSGAVLHSETVAPAAVSGGPLWPADGVVGPVPIVATDSTMTVRFTDQVGGDFIDALLDNVSLLGPGVPGTSATEAQQFMRHLCRACDGTATITDTTLDGTTAYVVAGTVGQCPTDVQRDCASPTEPTATVGLCLADGTPIAVTVVRDCAGTVTSEGWLNLTSGAWTAGAVPTGTVACGDSRSIQVSGTFCDIDAAGEVVGLVLVEYTYDDTGAISSVRLVDAVTGDTYTPTGTVTVCPAGVEQPEQDAVVLCDTAADGTVTSFLRDFRRDENGAIVGHSDYHLDGTAYAPTGTVGTCTPEPCLNCESMLLCDEGGNDPATIRLRGVSSGTLPNGVTWSSRGTQPLPSTYDNADGAWWGIASFPNPVFPNSTWTFSRPATVEFSVYLRYFASATASDNTAQLPAGLEVVSLPDGFTYDPVTGILTATADTGDDPCTYLTDPHVATSARFRTPNPVTSVTARYLGPRIAVCGQFGSYKIGAFQVTPPGQFLRTVCRDCDGAVSSVLDTELDGTTAYTPLGAVGVCQPPPDPEPEPCCQPVQVCIQQDTTQEVEFVSNEAHLNNSSVDPVWKWTPDLSAANPPWYDMYEFQYSGAWSVTDTDTARPAWWVSPHPTGGIQQSSPALPNEGPTLTAQHWYPRAYFDLPDNADPATIQVQATVFNADQIGRAFRLNNGAWQALPATATHNGTPYTFGPATIPGAQAGRNFLYLDVEETVGGGAGLMVHLKVTYEVIPETRSWTRMICCDDTVYYLDEDGQRQDIPDGWHLAPCGGSGSASNTDCTKQVVERCGCDDTDGDGLGDETYTELWAVDPCGGADPELLGAFLDGDLTQPYTPVAPVECTAAEALPGPLSTGVRAVTGTAPQNLAGSFAGLQSVSLTVLAGTVNVTMNDGAAVPVPAGVTMTWSVAQDSDTALAAASFAGAAAGASYLLNWTWK
jgi:hypothetical protein